MRGELHDDFDGRELAGGIGGDLDVRDLADGDAFEGDGRADFDAGGVVEERVDDDALLEEADAGAGGHEEEQGGEQQDRDQHDGADLELRPADLSLTGHGGMVSAG